MRVNMESFDRGPRMVAYPGLSGLAGQPGSTGRAAGVGTASRRLAVLAMAALLALVMAATLGCGGKKQVYSSSDAGTASTSGGGGGESQSAGQRPYTIKGETYHPLPSADGFMEEGLASWYGKDFHGRPTANGETYDMYAMTAAHKLLPFNTRVRVFNLENGKSVDVRINDRGPFVKNRIIDLTYTGAKKIGIVTKGVARVRVSALSSVPGYNPQNQNLAGAFYVQIGSFTIQDNARTLLGRVHSRGMRGRVQYAVVGGKSFWRVQVGVYPDLNAAEQARNRLERSYPAAFVIAD